MKITNELYNKIEKYVELGYITKQKYDTLVHYNYDRKTTFEKKWNDATMIARGLIIDENNRDIVAKPFSKFFNYHEIQQNTIPFHLPQETTLKLDGVFAFCFYYKGELKWATRWNIETPMALLAKKMFNENHPDVIIPDGMNVLFEIIHPDTKILCEYNYSDLVCIGIFDLHNDKDFNHSELKAFCDEQNLNCVELLPFDIFTAMSVCKTLDRNEEGYVIRFSNGLRIKTKGEEYVRLARLMQGYSDKQVTITWVNHKDSDLRNDNTIPEEFRDLLISKLDKLDAYEDKLLNDINSAYETIKHAHDQKEYASWVNTNYKAPMNGFLFSMRGQRPLKIREYILTSKLFYDIISSKQDKEE